LPAGGVEEVRTRTLRDQLGERLIALAGADFAAPPSRSASAS
jgi:23S rRNA pseudouridine2605 synthase